MLGHLELEIQVMNGKPPDVSAALRSPERVASILNS